MVLLDAFVFEVAAFEAPHEERPPTEGARLSVCLEFFRKLKNPPC